MERGSIRILLEWLAYWLHACLYYTYDCGGGRSGLRQVDPTSKPIAVARAWAWRCRVGGEEKKGTAGGGAGEGQALAHVLPH